MNEKEKELQYIKEEIHKNLDEEESRNRFKDELRKAEIEDHIRSILRYIGADTNSEGLKETPSRVRRMLDEIFEGMQYSNDEIAKMFNKTFSVKSNDLVTMTKIPIFSFCEHHMALMYNMHVSVGYIPNGTVIGLSKIARIADMVGKRLQLQERIGSDIREILMKILFTKDVIVVVEGEHSCMTIRGIKKPGTITRTSSSSGRFRSDADLRKEFYSLLK